MYANIIIDISHEKLDRPFQYLIPQGLENEVKAGVQVIVPFGSGNREIKGYVIGITHRAEYEVDKIKEIKEIVRGSVLIESHLISLADWMQKNYGGTMNQSLKTVLPVKQKTKIKEEKQLMRLLDEEAAKEMLLLFEKKHHTARARLLSELIRNPIISYEIATKEFNISGQTIQAMQQLNILKVSKKQEHLKTSQNDDTKQLPFSLNAGQQSIVDAIGEDLNRGVENTYLLHGVTGSGKTAVYIKLIQKVVQMGKQAIVLIPEIALTYQTLKRFYQTFGDRVSVLNSKMSKGERYEQFLRAKNNDIDVMIGPRSALFTPFTNLGFIIIDEEHESSYKSESQPRYHARETSIRRGKMTGASVLLGSATPSIDSYKKAKAGEFVLFELNERIDHKPMPECHIVDLRNELKNGNRSILSERLSELMEERLKKREQIMLFLNRRGVSGFVSCRSCGYVFKCPHCDISLSSHNNRKFVCHYCGYSIESQSNCPDCGSNYVSGFKAGTQKIEQVVSKRFPDAKVLRMDFDTTRNKEGHEKILSAFAEHKADILIGTQMIVKGHDFLNVTLVGVLAADLSLYISDFHAPERTFQLLTQAAGRAGRGNRPGEVVIQTYDPEHYSIKLAKQQDYRAFYEKEIVYRNMLKYPPIWQLLGLLVTSKDEETATLTAKLLCKKLEQTKEKNHLDHLQIIGPSDAPVAKVKDTYKKVIYMKHMDYSILIRIKDAIELFVKNQQGFKNVYIQFDFNPVNGF